MESPNLKLLLGQFALYLLIILGLGFSVFFYSISPNTTCILIFIWTLLFIPIALWTRTNPRKAFLTAAILYGTTVIVKDIVVGGEYALPFLFHVFFIVSMFVGRSSQRIENK